MQRKAIVVGLTLLFLTSASYALDLVGPPKSLLDQGHWGLGVEYAYSETAVDLTDVSPPDLLLAGRSSQLLSNRAYANLRYGAWKNVDVFARLGVVTFDLPWLDGDAGFAWGLGAAATLYDRDKFDWGLLVQFSSGTSAPHPMGGFEIEAVSVQIVTGPTYQIQDDLAVYGGVFTHLLLGEFEMFDDHFNADLEEEGEVGALVGLDWQVKENAHWSVELQYGGATFAIATGLRWVLD